MSTSQKIILSIDDSLTIRKLIENALEPTGHRVLMASSGEEGLRLALEAKPDLILLDYVLPDVRGVEFCQRLNNEPSTRHIPVLLISGHGSAIQELYRDCGNVVDYLTKPFAANVLQAVVANVLGRAVRTTAPAGEQPLGADTAPGAPLTIATGGAAAPEAAAQPAPAPDGATGAQSPAADAAQVAELRQRIFEKVVARLHGPLPSIPAWEAARGEQDPFSYYLSRLLPLDLLGELADDLVETGRRLAGAAHPGGRPARGEPPMLCGSTRFVSERHVLNHLLHEGVTGELTLTLPEEVVSVFYAAGAIVGISSNHPRFYCAGSSFPFLQVPHAVVSAAMIAQREERVPFFVTAHAQGVQSADTNLPELLRECGHRCMGRVNDATDIRYAFSPLAELPAFVRDHRVDFSLPQLLLESYRCVSDWQQIQEEVPRLELIVGHTAAYNERYLATLSLNALEISLLEHIDFRRTVGQLQEAVNQPLFEVCRALFCLARIDLCYLSDLPLVEDELTAETDAASAADNNMQPIPEEAAVAA